VRKTQKLERDGKLLRGTLNVGKNSKKIHVQVKKELALNCNWNGTDDT
jgi:hypothetical protein